MNERTSGSWLSHSCENADFSDAQIIEVLEVVANYKPLAVEFTRNRTSAVKVGDHALPFAVKNGRLELVKYLLQNGVSTDYVHYELKTGLHQALQSNHENKVALVELLLDATTALPEVITSVLLLMWQGKPIRSISFEVQRVA